MRVSFRLLRESCVDNFQFRGQLCTDLEVSLSWCRLIIESLLTRV